MADLNRALCEKLSIPPITRTCTCGHDRDEHLSECYGDADLFRQCPCAGFVEESADYPQLSRSHAGMYLLQRALLNNGCAYQVDYLMPAATVAAWAGRTVTLPADTAPMALALAAAAALGIEVQP